MKLQEAQINTLVVCKHTLLTVSPLWTDTEARPKLPR